MAATSVFDIGRVGQFVMDLRRSTEDDAFRTEVRAFLARHLPADMALRNSRGFHTNEADRRYWTGLLAEHGWSGSNWPTAYGGPGWTPAQQMIFEEESMAAGAPTTDVQIGLVGPMIYTFGSEDLKDRFLEPTRTGKMLWGQGFSEPNAGSDLASLSTRAVREGEDYVLSGRKIWTTDAHIADQMFVLASTAPELRQRGLSMFVFPADTKGLTIRPIIGIGGDHSLNEMFLDDVRVPIANLVGEEGKGWTYAKFLLELERAFAAQVPRNKRSLARLKRIATTVPDGERRLIDDPLFALKIAEAEAALSALEFLTLRALSSAGSPLPYGSMLKIAGSELQQRLGDLQVEALGVLGALDYGAEDGGDRYRADEIAPGVLADFLYHRAMTIWGGSNEIQRNIIAKDNLNL